MATPSIVPSIARRHGLLLAACLLALPPGAAASEPVRLSLNENPFGPSPLAIEAVKADLEKLARYTDTEAADELIALVAAREGVAPEQIVLGEVLVPLGLHLGSQGGPGGEFVYSVPGYPALVDAAASVGGIVVGVPLDASLANDLPAIAASVNPRTRAVFLVNPHNPSGTVSDAEAFKAVLREVSRRALVVVDEAYLEFSDDYAGRTAVSLTREGENVLVFRTFAKAYGLAGLQIGYAVAPRAVADLLRSKGVGAPRSLDRLAVAAATASLRDTGYLGRIATQVAHERGKWNDFFRAQRIEHTSSQGNFVYFDARRPAAEVAAALLERGVEVGRVFAPYDTWVRISIGLPEENDKARAALSDLLSNPPSGSGKRGSASRSLP